MREREVVSEKPKRVWIATSHGSMGGGEVMLLRIAEALRELHVDVTVVAPRHPAALLTAAESLGLQTEPLAGEGRLGWMRALRAWDRRERDGLLWCNGLMPAVATAGHPDRVVHLHQHPVGVLRWLSRLARRGALATLVPSVDMLRSTPDARVLANWTAPFRASTRERAEGEPFAVGFLGRVGPDKGVHVLAEAIRLLDERHPGRFRMRLAGEPLFVKKSAAAQVDEALAAVESVTDRLGWVDPVEFFDSIDVLAVPSVWSEPFGLVAAEAMAARVPVVVSDAGALPAVVGDVHGKVVPVGDARALADRIEAITLGAEQPAIHEQFTRWQLEHSPEAGRRRVNELIELYRASVAEATSS